MLSDYSLHCDVSSSFWSVIMVGTGLNWPEQLEEGTLLGAQPSTIINLAAGAGSWLESCLLDDMNVPVQFSPVGTGMWPVMVKVVVKVEEWT